MNVDQTEDLLGSLKTNGVVSSTREFNFGEFGDAVRIASAHTRRCEDSGGSFYTITLDRLPIEAAAEILATFMNCRSA